MKKEILKKCLISVLIFVSSYMLLLVAGYLVAGSEVLNANKYLLITSSIMWFVGVMFIFIPRKELNGEQKEKKNDKSQNIDEKKTTEFKIQILPQNRAERLLLYWTNFWGMLGILYCLYLTWTNTWNERNAVGFFLVLSVCVVIASCLLCFCLIPIACFRKHPFIRPIYYFYTSLNFIFYYTCFSFFVALQQY